MTIANTDERLLRLIERIETLETEKKEVADLIKDVYAEAKAVGYDTKILRQIIKIRGMNPDDRREHYALLGTYANALGLDLGFDLL